VPAATPDKLGDVGFIVYNTYPCANYAPVGPAPDPTIGLIYLLIKACFVFPKAYVTF
tara:strand:- start:156 stop:326 length:171 start_codon:yes stop_codon:yes gene_type:complete